jgi:Plasmid pRiA4b ORF-3-like protein
MRMSVSGSSRCVAKLSRSVCGDTCFLRPAASAVAQSGGMTAAVLRLKVTLNDVEPKVLRRIEVPADIKLDRLHLTLQAALGWTNSHLYEIRARDVRLGLPSRDWPDGPLDARKAKLIDVLEDAGAKILRYLYDYGGSWEHTIKVERMAPLEIDVLYPRQGQPRHARAERGRPGLRPSGRAHVPEVSDQ